MNAREQFVFLDALAGILIRCFILTVVFVLLWFAFYAGRRLRLLPEFAVV